MDSATGAGTRPDRTLPIPSARLELFEGETHMLPVERSRDVARTVAAFLARG